MALKNFVVPTFNNVVWLSVSAQSIAWKDMYPKWPVMCQVGR